MVIISPIADISQFHLNICKEIEQGKKPRKSTVKTSSGQVLTFDYFNLLEKDLRAMEMLNKRYKRVSMFHGEMISEMRDIINRNKDIMSYPEIFIIPIPNYPQHDDILARQLEEFDDFK